jgi:hypothetical protein
MYTLFYEGTPDPGWPKKKTTSSPQTSPPVSEFQPLENWDTEIAAASQVPRTKNWDAEIVASQ